MLMSERAEGKRWEATWAASHLRSQWGKKRLFYRMIESEGPIAQQLILRSEQALVRVASRVQSSNFEVEQGVGAVSTHWQHPLTAPSTQAPSGPLWPLWRHTPPICPFHFHFTRWLLPRLVLAPLPACPLLASHLLDLPIRSFPQEKSSFNVGDLTDCCSEWYSVLPILLCLTGQSPCSSPPYLCSLDHHRSSSTHPQPPATSR